VSALPANRRVAPRPKPSDARAPSEAPAKPEKKASPRRSWNLGEKLRGVITVSRIVAGALTFSAVVAGSSFGLYRYVSSTPRFAIKKIVVDGVSHRTEEEIARRGGVVTGKNVFTLDLEVARRAILADPWVESASVTRKLPSTVSINVVEREAAALVAISGSLYLATRGGEVFKRVEPGDPTDFVLITGVGGEGEMVRDRAGVVALVKRAEDVIADYERTIPGKQWALQEVHVTDEGGIDVIVGRDPVRLAMGKPPYRPKLERGARVLSEIDRRKGQPQVVFLDNDAHPERVVARLR
jgi:cell division protein FtsQ